MAKKRIAPSMEELFAKMPEMPPDWKDECMKNVPSIPIYYRIKGNYADCTCGHCGCDYKIRFGVGSPDQELIPAALKPGRNEKTKCKLCGAEGEYEWKKYTQPRYFPFTELMMQKCSDGNVVVRYIKCQNIYEQGKMQIFFAEEKCRMFLTMGDYYRFYANYYYGWCKYGDTALYEDYLYPGSMEALEESNLKYYVRSGNTLMEDLKAYAKNPAIEMMQKAGLDELADELIRKGGVDKRINRRGTSMKAQMRLKDKGRIKFLIKVNGGLDMLQVLQTEEKEKKRYTDNQRKWLALALRSPWVEKDIKYLLGFMSFEKLYNRVQRYRKEDDRCISETGILSEYADYLKMRIELGYDLSNELYVFPRSLKEKHDQMVEEKNAKADAEYEAKKEKEFPKIRERYTKLAKKYEFSKDGLLIRPAGSATEIIAEGRRLHHCVGRLGYMEKHNNGQTFILFLRKEETPSQPYYTIEIKDKEILQWYGCYDKKPDKEVIGPWLNDFIAHIGGNQVVYAS